MGGKAVSVNLVGGMKAEARPVAQARRVEAAEASQGRGR